MQGRQCQIYSIKCNFRKDTPGYSSRTIDIDILFYNDMILQDEELIIPHPEIPNRKFVLAQSV